MKSGYVQVVSFDPSIVWSEAFGPAYPVTLSRAPGLAALSVFIQVSFDPRSKGSGID